MDLAIIDATLGAPRDGSDGFFGSRYVTPIANTPLVCHVLAELAQSGIAAARVITVPGAGADLERTVADGGSAGLQVSYTEAPDGEHRRTVLAELGDALRSGPVLLHPGDCLLGGQVMAMRDRFRAGDVDSVLPEQASAATRRHQTDPRVSETALVLGPETRPLVDGLLSPAADGEDLIGVLLHSDYRLAVCELTEQWVYGQSTDALLAANRMVLDTLTPEPVNGYDEGNDLHGRITVGRGAFISNCVIHGPVAIADRAVLEDSFIGPYTAIGRDVILSGTEIDNSMVMAGAEIRHPGHRIEASIIGERAQLTRSFDLPRGIHLRLGPGSQVRFS